MASLIPRLSASSTQSSSVSTQQGGEPGNEANSWPCLSYYCLTLDPYSTEANDLALRIAEAVTGHTEVIAIDG